MALVGNFPSYGTAYYIKRYLGVVESLIRQIFVHGRQLFISFIFISLESENDKRTFYKTMTYRSRDDRIVIEKSK